MCPHRAQRTFCAPWGNMSSVLQPAQTTWLCAAGPARAWTRREVSGMEHPQLGLSGQCLSKYMQLRAVVNRQAAVTWSCSWRLVVGRHGHHLID
jgi:hypothetical protein